MTRPQRARPGPDDAAAASQAAPVAKRATGGKKGKGKGKKGKKKGPKVPKPEHPYQFLLDNPEKYPEIYGRDEGPDPDPFVYWDEDREAWTFDLLDNKGKGKRVNAGGSYRTFNEAACAYWEKDSDWREAGH